MWFVWYVRVWLICVVIYAGLMSPPFVELRADVATVAAEIAIAVSVGVLMTGIYEGLCRAIWTLAKKISLQIDAHWKAWRAPAAAS